MRTFRFAFFLKPRTGCGSCLNLKKQMEKKLKDGQKIWVLNFGSWERARIFKNTQHPEVSEYYVRYADGDECAVLDFSTIKTEKPNKTW